MKKKGILLVVVVFLCICGFAQAQEELGVTLDVTYVSRYIWRGIDRAASDFSAIQPSIDLDLWGTGFGFNVWHTQSRKHVNEQELNFTLYYADSFFEVEPYATDYKVGWKYYSYPDMPRVPQATTTSLNGDAQEFFLDLSWPELCPMGIVPSYSFITMWQADGGGTGTEGFRKAGGSIHVFGLGYDLAVPGILPDTAEQILNLSVAAVYNDGMAGSTVEHDWSHIVWGVSTSVPVADNLTFTPGLFYQTSMEDTVNKSDEYWTSLSLTYKF